MSTKPTVSDSELVDLIAAVDHPLSTKEISVMADLDPIITHNRLMMIHGIDGTLDSYPGPSPSSRIWHLAGEFDE